MINNDKNGFFSKIIEGLNKIRDKYDPVGAKNREISRQVLRILHKTREIDAVSANRWTNEWVKGGSGPNQFLAPQRDALVNLVRNLFVNNAVVRGIIEKNTCFVIGKGITPQLDFTKLNFSDFKREKCEKVFKDAWDEWCFAENSDTCKTEDFNQRQRTMFDTYQRDGEFLLLITRGRGKYTFSTEIIECDRLEKTAGYPSSNLEGIEFDDGGAPKAYHVISQPKNDSYIGGYFKQETRRIDKYDKNGFPQVLHFFRQERPHQKRGISPLTPALTEIEELIRFREAVIMCGRISALYGIYLSGADSTPLGMRRDTDGNNYFEIEPGMVQSLPAGAEVKTVEPKNPPQSYDTILKNQLRIISIAMNVPYEILFSMTGEVNYSTMKSCMTTAFYKYGIEQALFSRNIITPIAQLLANDLVLMGQLPNIGKPYPIKCFPPEQEWLDPLKEIQGITVGLNQNMTTLEEQLALKNKDWRNTIDQRIAEEVYETNKRKEYGLPPKNEMKNIDNSPGKPDSSNDIEKPKVDKNVQEGA